MKFEFKNKSAFEIFLEAFGRKICLRPNQTAIFESNAECAEFSAVLNQKSYIKHFLRLSFLPPTYYDFVLRSRFKIKSHAERAEILLYHNKAVGYNTEKYEAVVPISENIEIVDSSYSVSDEPYIRSKMKSSKMQSRLVDIAGGLIDIVQNAVVIGIITLIVFVIAWIASNITTALTAAGITLAVCAVLSIIFEFISHVVFKAVFKKISRHFNKELDKGDKTPPVKFSGADSFFDSNYIKGVIENDE